MDGDGSAWAAVVGEVHCCLTETLWEFTISAYFPAG